MCRWDNPHNDLLARHLDKIRLSIYSIHSIEAFRRVVVLASMNVNIFVNHYERFVLTSPHVLLAIDAT